MAQISMEPQKDPVGPYVDYGLFKTRLLEDSLSV